MHLKTTIFTLIILPLFFLSKLTFADFESGLNPTIVEILKRH